MWFFLGIENFIAKQIIYDDCYKLYISDLSRIWHTSLCNEELTSISRRLNPLFEASVQKLKEVTSNLIQEEKTEKEITEENNTITLKLKSNSLGVKYLFHVVLYQQNEKIFYEEFTLPLLLVLIQSRNREEKLMKIITEKDAEIKEYKQEYGVIRSGHVGTEPFDKEKFECQESVTSVCNINSYFECINSILAVVKQEQPPCENLVDNYSSDSSRKCITKLKQRIIGDKTVRRNGLCIKLEGQLIKKKKKQCDAFKIKF